MTTEQEVKATLERARKYVEGTKRFTRDAAFWQSDALINDLVQLVESLTLGDKSIARTGEPLGERSEVVPVVATGPDEYGSVYVCFQPSRRDEDGVVGKVVRHGDNCVIDLDKDGKLFGIEVLDVDAAMGAAPTEPFIPQIQKMRFEPTGQDKRRTEVAGRFYDEHGRFVSLIGHALGEQMASAMGAAPIDRAPESQSPKITPYGICSHCGADINPPDPTPRML